MSNFVQEYTSGRTPLPCAHCNSDLKFSTLLERASALGAARVATGHYARVDAAPDGRRLLRRGVDPDKDQSYFLFSLTQDQLAQASFPVGPLTKGEVRDHARRLGLTVADKPDSQEICFVPGGDYAAFVESKAEGGTRPGPHRRRRRATPSARTTACTASPWASARGWGSRRPCRSTCCVSKPRVRP